MNSSKRFIITMAKHKEGKMYKVVKLGKVNVRNTHSIVPQYEQIFCKCVMRSTSSPTSSNISNKITVTGGLTSSNQTFKNISTKIISSQCLYLLLKFLFDCQVELEEKADSQRTSVLSGSSW